MNSKGGFHFNQRKSGYIRVLSVIIFFILIVVNFSGCLKEGGDEVTPESPPTILEIVSSPANDEALILYSTKDCIGILLYSSGELFKVKTFDGNYKYVSMDWNYLGSEALVLFSKGPEFLGNQELYRYDAVSREIEKENLVEDGFWQIKYSPVNNEALLVNNKGLYIYENNIFEFITEGDPTNLYLCEWSPNGNLIGYLYRWNKMHVTDKTNNWMILHLDNVSFSAPMKYRFSKWCWQNNEKILIGGHYLNAIKEEEYTNLISLNIYNQNIEILKNFSGLDEENPPLVRNLKSDSTFVNSSIYCLLSQTTRVEFDDRTMFFYKIYSNNSSKTFLQKSGNDINIAWWKNSNNALLCDKYMIYSFYNDELILKGNNPHDYSLDIVCLSTYNSSLLYSHEDGKLYIFQNDEVNEITNLLDNITGYHDREIY